MPPDFDPDDGRTGPADLLARWMATMGPMLAAMQLGSAVGHLARSTMGPYELPIPRTTPRLLVVPANAMRFAEDWSLAPDEVRLWVCLRELTSHAVLSRPHVAERMRELLVRVVQGMAEDTAGLVDNLEGIDLTQPEALQGLLGDPTALMNLEPSPARRGPRKSSSPWWPRCSGTSSTSSTRPRSGCSEDGARSPRRGAVDRSTARARTAPPSSCSASTSGRPRSTAARTSCAACSSGPATTGLARLWSGPHTLPTPAEVDAPGLWLERIDLTEPDS